MSDDWYCAAGDKSVGPLTLNDLKKILSLVTDARTVLVWRKGLSNWEKAERVPELAHVVGAPPPPVSKAPPAISKGTLDKLKALTTNWRGNWWGWTFWWKIVDDQVERYDTLSFIRSARGVAVLCLLYGCATMLMLGQGLIDVTAFAILAIFIYLGYQWAMIVAMLLWTAEKSLDIINAIDHTDLAFQVIWWCLYMIIFYFAFSVEQQRKAPASAAPAQARLSKFFSNAISDRSDPPT